jgi:hypothetical protein
MRPRAPERLASVIDCLHARCRPERRGREERHLGVEDDDPGEQAVVTHEHLGSCSRDRARGIERAGGQRRGYVDQRNGNSGVVGDPSHTAIDDHSRFSAAAAESGELGAVGHAGTADGDEHVGANRSKVLIDSLDMRLWREGPYWGSGSGASFTERLADPTDEIATVDQRAIADQRDPSCVPLVDELTHASERTDAVHDSPDRAGVEGTNGRIDHRNEL